MVHRLNHDDDGLIVVTEGKQIFCISKRYATFFIMSEYSSRAEHQAGSSTLQTRLSEKGDRNASYDLKNEEDLLRQFDRWIHQGQEADQKSESISYARFKLLMEAVVQEYDAYFGTGTVQNIPELWLGYMKLRFQAHEQVDSDLRRRAEKNPHPTHEERLARTFYEDLESPVRDAVFALRRKGYPTSLSGFFPRGPQMICFETEDGEAYDPHFSPEFISYVRERYGVALRYADAAISFLPSRLLTMQELHDIWNHIEQSVPDRGAAAPPIKPRGSKWDEIFN